MGLHNTGNRGEVPFFKALLDGTCDAAIIPDSSYAILDNHNDYSAKLGGYQYVGPTLFSIPEAAPIIKRFLEPINFHMRNMVETNEYTRLYTQYAGKPRNNPYVAGASPTSTKRKPLKAR